VEVILREDVPGLGIIGEVVRVKPGYARNFLLPRGIAVEADQRRVKELEHHKRIIEAKKGRERSGWEERAGQLDGTALETEARASKRGRLFGSVSSADIAALLADKGYEIDRRQIMLAEPIKRTGTHEVGVRVGQDVRASVTVEVKAAAGSELAEEDGSELEQDPEGQPASEDAASEDDGSEDDAPEDDAPEDDAPEDADPEK
jgi:large subunit ribosomal protein L9